MAVPRCRVSRFNLGGIDFYHSHTRDSHGTVCDVYMADNHSVSQEEFHRLIKESVSGAESYIALVCGMVKVR